MTQSYDLSGSAVSEGSAVARGSHSLVALPALQESPDEPEMSIDQDLEQFHLRQLINDTGFMMLDNELPQDAETQRNTLHNALMYGMSDDELKSIDPHYLSDSEAEMSPRLRPVDGPLFQRGVTLDTFATTPDLSKYQVTLTGKHAEYVFKKSGRTLVCAYDNERASWSALAWAMKEMICDYDTLVVFSVLDPESDTIFSTSSYSRKYEKLLERVRALNEEHRKIRIIIEFKVGNVEYMVNKAVKDYNPAFLIVGTKGIEKTGFLSLKANKSMAKYFLDSSSVPVVVINPLYEVSRAPLIDTPGPNTFASKLLSCPLVEDGIRPVTSAESYHRKSRFMRVGRSLARASSAPGKTISFLKRL